MIDLFKSDKRISNRSQPQHLPPNQKHIFIRKKQKSSQQRLLLQQPELQQQFQQQILQQNPESEPQPQHTMVNQLNQKFTSPSPSAKKRIAHHKKHTPQFNVHHHQLFSHQEGHKNPLNNSIFSPNYNPKSYAPIYNNLNPNYIFINNHPPSVSTTHTTSQNPSSLLFLSNVLIAKSIPHPTVSKKSPTTPATTNKTTNNNSYRIRLSGCSSNSGYDKSEGIGKQLKIGKESCSMLKNFTSSEKKYSDHHHKQYQRQQSQKPHFGVHSSNIKQSTWEHSSKNLDFNQVLASSATHPQSQHSSQFLNDEQQTQSCTHDPIFASLLPTPVKQSKNSPSPTTSVPCHYFTFAIANGNNNEELIRKILLNRKKPLWKEIKLGSEVPNFKWLFSKEKYNYKKVSKSSVSSLAQKRLVNHFQFNEEICTKDNLVKNLQLYCETKKMELFTITPITFIIDFEDQYCEFNLRQFIQFFNKNDPRGNAGSSSGNCNGPSNLNNSHNFYNKSSNIVGENQNKETSNDSISKSSQPPSSTCTQSTKNISISTTVTICTTPPPAVTMNTFISRFQPYMLYQKSEIKKKINPLSRPINSSSYYSRNSYLWFLKPTGLNRGRGLEIFDSLERLCSLLLGFLNELNQNKNISVNKQATKGSQKASSINNASYRSSSKMKKSLLVSKKQKNSQNEDNQGMQDHEQKTENSPSAKVKAGDCSLNMHHQSHSQTAISPPNPIESASESLLQDPQSPSTSPPKSDSPNQVHTKEKYKLKNCSFVIQKYIEKPLLIENRKFDIRVWALLTENLELYFFKEGYIRTSTEEYSTENIDNYFIHLTNNAIQKNSTNYGQYENGNQLPFRQLSKYLQSEERVELIWERMKQITYMTFSSVKKKINPNKYKNCFEFFGLDFFISYDEKVWLIEVNENPCLECSSSLLEQYIPRMIHDGFRITLDPMVMANTPLNGGVTQEISGGGVGSYGSGGAHLLASSHGGAESTGYHVDGWDDRVNMWESLGFLVANGEYESIKQKKLE